jgi:hypothetical protein
MTIWERVASALSVIGATVPVSAGQKMVASGVQLPDQFIVYFLVSSPAEQHADDAETLRSYRVQVSIFSRSGLAGLPDVSAAMVTAGFTRGVQRELPYNQVTAHYGLALEFNYLEEQE